VVPHIKNIVRPGDMVVAMGAGDVWKVAKDLIDTIGEAP
jgi:UDP-N-acetylmuramate--alanine ligase